MITSLLLAASLAGHLPEYCDTKLTARCLDWYINNELSEHEKDGKIQVRTDKIVNGHRVMEQCQTPFHLGKHANHLVIVIPPFLLVCR